MKNMAAAEMSDPANALCQVKNLKPGRKLGAEPILSMKHARFMVKNVNCGSVSKLAHTCTITASYGGLYAVPSRGAHRAESEDAFTICSHIPYRKSRSEKQAGLDSQRERAEQGHK